MNRLAYRVYRAASSLHLWAQRRLTPGGWILLVGLLLTAGMATDTEQSLGYQAFAFLLSLALVAMAAAPFFRARFAAERLLPRFGSVGQPLRYTVEVRNLSPRAQGGWQVLDVLADPRPTFPEFVALARAGARRRWWQFSTPPDLRRVRGLKPRDVPAVAPGGVAAVTMELTPLRRGVLHFCAITVARPDPFGLFRALRARPEKGALVVLPRRYALPAVPLPGSQRYQPGGVALASAIGESEEFVSLRDYRPGDPMRRIHWRSWARAGRPVVKEFQDEFFVRHALILDTFVVPEDGAAFEEAVSVAASFACTLDTQESLLDLLFVGPEAYSFTIGRGVAHADQMLELLAAVQPHPGRSFESLERLVLEHAPAVSGCICLFLAWDEPRRRLARRLAELSMPLLVLVVTPAGAAPPVRQPDDPERWHVLEAGRVEEGLSRL